MKSYYKIIVLILLSYSSITGAQAQLKAGTEGLYIKAGTTLSTDGLILTPSADVTLSDLSIEKSATPVSGSAGSGINRSYNLSTPVTFSGTLGFYYLTGELNNNTESLLQLVYKSTGAGTTYITTTGSSLNTTAKYIENTFTTTALSTLSAADPAIFVKSNNANLSALALSSGTLSPTFASGTENYTVLVANSVSSFTVTPTRDEANATITVNGTTVSSGSASGSIALNVGSNTLTTVVTAQDGTTTKTYTATITRAASTNASLSALALSTGTLSPTFASGTESYTSSVANSVSSMTVTPNRDEANATITVNGTTVSSGSASGSISLNVGSNTLTTVVTAQDGTTTKTYTATITRGASTNANLSALALSSGILSPTFASGTESYTASVANSISSITVTPTRDEANATITVNGTTVSSGSESGSISLNVGSNTLTTVIAAQDGTTIKTYTITVTRAASTNADLSALILSSGTLSPTFASGIKSYTASVANSISSMTVTPTRDETNAIITVNGTTVSNGSSSGSISLNVGSNTLTTVVVAQDGTSTRTYTVTVTRAAAISTNANLSALTLSTGTLSPGFASGTESYTASVANSISSLTIAPTRDEANATITVNGTMASSGSASGAISLSVGNNTITTVVTAQDEATTKTYTVTVTRDAASQTIEFSTLSVKTYGDANFTLPENASSGLSINYVSDNTSVATISGNTVTIKNAGTAKIIASQAGNSNYNAANQVEQNLIINKKVITVTAVSKNKIYNEADPVLTHSITTGTLIGNDTFTGSLVRETGEDVGNYPIKQGTLSLGGNYELTYAGANLEIGRKSISIIASSKNKIYGDADPALTYSVSAGALIGNDAFTGSLSREAGEGVGNYLIKQGTLSLGGNYDLTYAAANLEISKKAISIIALSKSKVYGEADPALTYSVTTGVLIGSDAFTGSLARETGEGIGNYLIKQGTISLGGNYDLTYAGANLEISKKVISINASSKSKIYGETDPALTYSITAGALLGSDVFTGALSRDAGGNTGIYGIKQGTLALNSNYSLSYTGANFTIGKKDLAVIAENKSKTYGDANPLLTATYIGLVNGDIAINPAPVITTSATAGSAVGTYDIEPNASSANYSITFTKGVLTVGKKLLTVTADNKTKLQNTANPVLTINYNGFIAGENQNNLTTQPTAGTTATTLSAVGTYAITVSGGISGNYSYTYLPGTLTVTPGIPTSINLAMETVYENVPTGTIAGTLSSTSGDATATFTYSLVSGNGGTDNGLFTIAGNQIKTAASLNFEQKSSYAVRVRSTTQQNLFLDKELIISINNVNEQPTLDGITNQVICYTTAQQSAGISGVTAGPDAGQSTTISVSTTNNALFESLEVTQANASGNAVINYKISNGSFGNAVINVMVMDNGGTANSGINTILKSFTIQVDPLPQVTISSNKGLVLSKGETALLTAVGGETYQWTNLQGIVSGQNTATLTVRPTETSTYKVLVTNINGCTTEQEITITVNADFEMVIGTNIMSPNGDGVNDNLIIKNIDMYPKNEVKIYDRAGRLLYSQKNYTDQWDGTLNGSPLAENTYYYIVDFGPGIPPKKGFISIVKD